MDGYDNIEMETFPQETGNDVDLFLNSPYEGQSMQSAVVPFSQPQWETVPAPAFYTPTDMSTALVPAPTLPVWQSAQTSLVSAGVGKRFQPTTVVERDTKVKKRKQQHQQKDKERRHKINDGLRELGKLVQSATGSFTKLDQPTIVSSSINLITALQNELNALRIQLAGVKDKAIVEEKVPVVKAETHGHHDGACPIFASLAGAGVAMIMIRADDLAIVEANAILANILGYTDPMPFVGTAVWDKPLHSRLYQLDAHGRVVSDNSNPFSFGEPKVKVEESLEYSKPTENDHIDCLWTARTANGNTLSARVSLSILKGDDAKPTHFLLCSLPSQRSVSTASTAVSPAIQLPQIEVAC